MEKSDGKQNGVVESEQMLAEIEKAQQALKQSKAESVTESQASPAHNAPAKAPEPTAMKEAAPQGQAVSQQETPLDKKTDKSDVDIREWAQRKGLKDADSAFRSLRELEQKLSRTTAELKARELGGQPPVYQPTPQWQPAPPPFYAPPPYQPYSVPMDRAKILEQEARRYNMEPDDFERVLALSNDIASMQTKRMQAQVEARLEEINRETRRNSELRELMQDPLFTNAKVQFEMHKVLEENPKALTLEPSPYVYAFNEAQRRLARQFLQDGPMEAEPSSNLPNKPPIDTGKASSPTFEKNNESKLIEEFNQAKTADQQKMILSRLGAVPQTL